MKKLLSTLLMLAIAVTMGSYLIIPNSNSAAETTSIATNHNAIFRILTEPEILSRLVNSKTTAPSTGISVFEYNNVNMQFQERMNDIIEVTMGHEGESAKSLIKVIPKGRDSALVEWRMPISLSNNPFKRIQQYIQVKSTKADMASFLNKLKAFAIQPENIYGFAIKKTKLSDSLLITTKAIFPTTPSTDAYYNLISQLQAYAESQNALITNYPMLNITTINNNQYETMVALPINKEIPGSSDIKFKRMVPGNILVTEVKGGPQEINQGLNQLSNYMSDRNLIAPAIPFQSLITDRLSNKDSNHWITKLYYPIF